jgi:hypothetical protein
MDMAAFLIELLPTELRLNGESYDPCLPNLQQAISPHLGVCYARIPVGVTGGDKHGSWYDSGVVLIINDWDQRMAFLVVCFGTEYTNIRPHDGLKPLPTPTPVPFAGEIRACGHVFRGGETDRGQQFDLKIGLLAFLKQDPLDVSLDYPRKPDRFGKRRGPRALSELSASWGVDSKFPKPKREGAK